MGSNVKGFICIVKGGLEGINVESEQGRTAVLKVTKCFEAAIMWKQTNNFSSR